MGSQRGYFSNFFRGAGLLGVVSISKSHWRLSQTSDNFSYILSKFMKVINQIYIIFRHIFLLYETDYWNSFRDGEINELWQAGHILNLELNLFQVLFQNFAVSRLKWIAQERTFPVNFPTAVPWCMSKIRFILLLIN